MSIKDKCNILIGLLLGVPRVTVDLPVGYHGKDYVSDYHVLSETMAEIYSKVMVSTDKLKARIKELEKERSEG